MKFFNFDFQDSEREKTAIRNAYIKGHGRIKFVMKNVPFLLSNDESRVLDIINGNLNLVLSKYVDLLTRPQCFFLEMKENGYVMAPNILAHTEGPNKKTEKKKRKAQPGIFIIQ